MGKPMTPSSCIMKIATTHIQPEEITHLTTTERLKIETYLELVVVHPIHRKTTCATAHDRLERNRRRA